MSAGCCSPAPQAAPSGTGAASVRLGTTQRRDARPHHDDILLPGATFLMGDAFGEGYADDGETPRHAVTVSPFAIDRAPVTVAQFASFVAATGYRTEAERLGASAVFRGAVHGRGGAGSGIGEAAVIGTAARTPWWVFVAGADWRHPYGAGSSSAGLERHPATHVSFADAVNYCLWSGRRLPTEAEWEYAARGGLDGARYPWGDELEPGGAHRCNIWQGEFPNRNDASDGFATTSPVGSFPANGFGLVDVSGNVWEWCQDWFAVDAYARERATDPIGPRDGDSRVVRGGSYLCHASYCNRYRVAARSRSAPSSTAGNLGFRTVAM